MARILIVDDKVKLCESLMFNFVERGFQCAYALDGKSAISTFRSESFDAVILDVRLGDEDGVEVLKVLHADRPSIPVIMVTGYATVASAVNAMKIGAVDYIQKPIRFPELFSLIQSHALSRRAPQNAPSTKDSLVYRSRSMADFVAKAIKLAGTDLPVLISGESGTGKELVAELIHANSSRKHLPLQRINCAAFSETLLDNELFGHERGAYTGADSQFKGVFEWAHKGSLFLDELGDMPSSIQSKILRAIQNQEIRRLGGHDTITIDVRFIAATNKNLPTLLGNNQFREDLYYRLSTAVLTVPPLRERQEDIPILSEFFLDKLALSRNEKRKSLDNTVMTAFLLHAWPGNVRELKSTLHYAAAVTAGDSIQVHDLPPTFLGSYQQGEKRVENARQPIMDTIERDLILKTLRETSYNKKRTAGILSMCRATLYNKMLKYGIQNDGNGN